MASNTIDALTRAGAHITLVSPGTDTGLAPRPAGARLHAVHTAPAPWTRAAWRSLRSGHPLSIERHASALMATRVTSLLRQHAFDLVHIEQPQALASAAPAIAAGLPAVLRAQNVESDVWLAAAAAGGWRAPLFQIEARRFRRFEADALSRVDTTMALSTRDAERLATLNPSARIVTVPPPFAALPVVSPAASCQPVEDAAPLGGRDEGAARVSSFTWIGSTGWHVNRDAVRWLTDELWPAMQKRMPDARLRLFGEMPADARATRIDRLGVADDSASAFSSHTILLLPLRAAIGIRMRLLEAWARGVPVIATPAAVAGLAGEDGRNLLIASTAEAFAEAGARLADDAGLRAALIAGGRETLARHHDPSTIARAMIAVYEAAIARGMTRAAGLR